MRKMCAILLLGLALVLPAPSFAPSASKPRAQVQALKVTILSTMLADQGIGEWGFAALVEADGRRILFDTGARPRTVLENASELKIDLSGITEVILSHNHDDHTGGLLTLRQELMKKNPSALSRVHVGDGIFLSRPRQDKGEGNPMVAIRRAYEGTGGTFIVHAKPAEIAPGVWLTGPVPRVHPERNWSDQGQLKLANGDVVEDTIPDDMSLVFDTAQGVVLLSGCGHAGVVNTVDYARKFLNGAPLHAALGGFHLFPADDKALAWTSEQLRKAGIAYLIGAHCTGVEAVYRIREQAKLDRRRCIVGAVGASFTLGKGIDPLDVAR